MISEKLIDYEQSVAGKPWAPWSKQQSTNMYLSYTCMALALAIGVGEFMGLEQQASDEGASAAYAAIWAASSALTLTLASWISLIAVSKLTPMKDPLTAILGIATAWIVFVVVKGFGHFVLVEAEWEVVWANRVLVLIGQQMTEFMTQSPGSEFCIDECYATNQNWRFWPILYLVFIMVGAAYGTTGDNWVKFCIGFALASGFLVAVASAQPDVANYHIEGPQRRLLFATALGYASFGASYYYCSISEEYKANRLRGYIAMLAVFTFFFTIVIMDPPETVQEIAKFVGIESMSEGGIKASQWGGLFVNLLIAAAGCVLGFGVGVVLAFGRQSELPFFKVPSVAVIELVRSGPLICWLYAAVFLMPDLIDPFYDAEDIMRMLIIFGLFGGCYIAEVLRGGLQAVDSGQKEAAMALGLSPFQTKIRVELPNAIRTTLPSIVSVFIGLWKDTTLLFIINILDFFKLAKDLPNTDLRFLGDFLEPLYVTAFVFWIFAFYLSRVSMRIEKSLGLVREGGGEAA
jgi:His/Glu/Gln/Arg/opine family amino acid ABC transporter permease subunit|tara:strand:- start:883 stop:2436 length:1554 start_codon:yes stop_codon:yes gene_type:complete